MFMLKIDTDNAAFNGDAPGCDAAKAYEVVSILRDTIRKLNEGVENGRLYDSNGNLVGSFKLS